LLASFPTRDVIAPFKKSEVKLGRLLGSGKFSHVYEIKSFDISSSTAASPSNKEEHELRQFMKSRELYRDYAVKHLRPELVDKYDSNEYSKYASDIVIKAKFLSMLQHPNIIRLHGISDEGSAGSAKGPSAYFLIIDKLNETLDDRIETWKKRCLKKKSSFELLQGSVSIVPKTCPCN
jgi:serine/threonine protein kinase